MIKVLKRTLFSGLATNIIIWMISFLRFYSILLRILSFLRLIDGFLTEDEDL